MQSLAALLLVPFMAMIFGVEEISGAGTYAVKNLFSEEAKNTMKELQQYINKMDQSFDEFGNQLKQENNVLEALKEYREIYKSAKKTKCQGEELPIQDDEELLDSFINDCVNSLPVDKLAAFNSKIKVSKAKVKAIDETLKANADTCEANPTTCEENKKSALKDMNSVLSAEAKADLEKDAHGVLLHAKKHLEECFTEESDELLEEVQTATNAITSCLHTLSESSDI